MLVPTYTNNGIVALCVRELLTLRPLGQWSQSYYLLCHSCFRTSLAQFASLGLFVEKALGLSFSQLPQRLR
jgi:hypothetical protein